MTEKDLEYAKGQLKTEEEKRSQLEKEIEKKR